MRSPRRFAPRDERYAGCVAMRGPKDRVNVIARRAMPDVAISYAATPQIPSWGYSPSEEVWRGFVLVHSFIFPIKKNERTNILSFTGVISEVLVWCILIYHIYIIYH